MKQPSSPSRPDTAARRLSWHLTRRYRTALIIGSTVCVIAGIGHSLIVASPTAFPRYGALITLFTIWHAFIQFRYLIMMEYDAEPIGLEVAQVLGKTNGAADRLTALRIDVQRRFLIDHLLAATLGTIVWGFGDLLFY